MRRIDGRSSHGSGHVCTINQRVQELPRLDVLELMARRGHKVGRREERVDGGKEGAVCRASLVPAGSKLRTCGVRRNERCRSEEELEARLVRRPRTWSAPAVTKVDLVVVPARTGSV